MHSRMHVCDRGGLFMWFRFVDTWAKATTSLQFIANTFSSFASTIIVRKSARSTLARKALKLNCRTDGTISCTTSFWVYTVTTRSFWDGRLARSVIHLDEKSIWRTATNALISAWNVVSCFGLNILEWKKMNYYVQRWLVRNENRPV